jgi:tetratricopeptide (TPR) repeat protein
MKPCLFLAIEGLAPEALASGRLPALEALAAEGIVAELAFPLADLRVATLVSAMTGTWPDQHGILRVETLDAAGDGLRPVAVSDRGQAAVWEPLDAHGVACISVGWPLAITGATQHSRIVGAGFGRTPSADLVVDLAPFVQPQDLAGGLADCWLRPDELEGEMLAPLVPQWQQVDQAVDNRLGLLGEVLAENVSRHAAFLELLDQGSWQFATLCLSLPAELASLERASESFADDWFAGMAGRGLEFLNAMLAAILQRLPAGTSVVVAGLPNAETPAAAGCVMASGPAFDAGCAWGRIEVPDLVPLVWAACGFRTAAMPGRGGLRAVRPSLPQRDFEYAWTPHPEYAPQSTERLLTVNEEIFRSPDTRLAPDEAWQFHALSGVARSSMARGDALQALPFWVAISRLLPYDPKSHLQLAQCQRQLGLMEEALDAAYAAVDVQFDKNPTPLLLAAELEVLSGRPEISRQLLARALPYLAGVERLRAPHANILILQREWAAATQLLEVVVRETPQDAHAQLLLARCHLAASQWQAAFDHAILSINLDASRARIHEILGHALLGLGMRAQAWQAFERATLVDPRWPRPWAKIVMVARLMNKPAEEVERHTAAYQKVKEEERQYGQALSEAARASL